MKHGDESICSFILPLVFHSTWRRHVDPDRLHMRGHSRRKKGAKKRGGDDLIRNLNDYKRTCFGAGETTKSVILGGLDGSSNQNVWSRMGEELALKLSKSVVSLALSDGHAVIFSCSGIAIDRKSHATRFLTSGSLVRALNNQAKHRDKVKIIVRHEGEVAVGLLEECDLDHDFSIVKIMSLLDVYVVSLNPALHHMPYCEVVSLGCDVTGKTMTTCGKLTCDSVTSKDHAYLMLSSCKLSEVWEGGPLFDFDVDFAGMNVVPSMERSFFLPQNLINERLQHFQTFQERIVLLEWAKHLKIARVRESLARNPLCSNLEVNGDARNKEQYDDLEALDYSRPSKSGMILINSFEEPFGDLYCKCVWRQLDKGVYNIIKRTVVSLASFEGDTMFFACSGFVIGWDDECAHNGYQTILTSACLVRNPEYPFNDRNKIVDSLRIKVVLPNKKHRQGTLMHYNLHYNVALVSFKESSSASPIILKHEMVNHSSKLVAVGRCFRSGDLMVSSGKMANLSSPFDYKKLPYKTTCEITKAGMGGPLVDICGHYIGMNFYHPEVDTPFLFCDDIIDILDCFKNGVRESLTNGVPCSHVEHVSNKDRHEDLGAFARLKKRMNLVDTFIEPFGDVYRTCAWRQLNEAVYKMIKQNVVSLASFKGATRFFACSGFVIDWDDEECGENECQVILTSACLARNPEYPFDKGNKIADGLRVVRLCTRKMHKRVNHSSKLVAVGRCFKTGDLMASIGKRVYWSGPFDCERLRYSTCKITKAGIGGPLLDIYGNYVGMNFYDPLVGTTMLFCDDIVKILDCFKKRSGAEADNFRFAGDDRVCLNVWPVSEPYWCDPGDLDGTDDHEYERRIIDSGRFKFIHGAIKYLK